MACLHSCRRQPCPTPYSCGKWETESAAPAERGLYLPLKDKPQDPIRTAQDEPWALLDKFRGPAAVLAMALIAAVVLALWAHS